MNDSIQTRNYFDVFDPPKSSLDLSAAGVPNAEVDADVVARCSDDFRSDRSQVVLLRKVLIDDGGDVAYYIFDVQYHDDQVVAYAVDRRSKRILFRFFVPVS